MWALLDRAEAEQMEQGGRRTGSGEATRESGADCEASDDTDCGTEAGSTVGVGLAVGAPSGREV